MEKRIKRGEQLYALAETQGGHFTAADAKALGYTYPNQHFHVKKGNWIRVDRGIFRLKHFPSSPYEDLIHWWLWSRKQGAVSHESAASVYDLGDLLPRKTHLTVPQNFRKVPPYSVILHKTRLQATDVERCEGFAVTTPLQTILDLAQSHPDPEQLGLVTREALRKGLVTRQEILNALANRQEKIDAATQVTLQMAVKEAA